MSVQPQLRSNPCVDKRVCFSSQCDSGVLQAVQSQRSSLSSRPNPAPPPPVSTPKLQVTSGQIVTEETRRTEETRTKAVSPSPSLNITREVHYDTSTAKAPLARIVVVTQRKYWVSYWLQLDLVRLGLTALIHASHVRYA